MKSIKFLATALSLSALLFFSACTQDTLEVGIDGNKPGITNLVLGEVTHASKSVTLSWSASSAVNAGAASFTVQFLENKDTTDGKLLKPDMYDATIAKTVDVARDENGNATATDYSATIDGQKVGSKYYIRVRVNYPMSVYSDWTWLTDANGNIAYYKVGRGTVTEGLEDPYLYKVTGTSTGLIVKWDEIPGALSYQIEYKASSASSWESATVNAGEATVYKINGLTSNTSYDVRALATYSNGNSDYCTTQTVSTRAPGSFKKEMGTAQELVDWLEGGVVEVGSSDVFSITADIDLTGISYTAMDESMIGTFDGKGHTISGISSPLFYEVETTGVLKNFTAKGTIASSDENVAAIALSNKGTIQDITSDVAVNYTVSSTNTMLVAGIVAENTGTVTGVTNLGNVTATASAALEIPVVVGGITAHSTGTLTDVHNEGAVALKASSTIYAVSVAGIVGYLEGPVTNSDNKGAVSVTALTPNGKCTLFGTSSATPAVAGIAGFGNTDAFAITNCTNDGPVTYDLSGIDKYTAANYNRTQVAGIVANPYGLVKDCTNNGAITINLKTTSGNALTGSGHEHIVCAGGIGGGDYFAGADQNLTSYDNCINNGNITADVASAQSNSAIGGICGWPGKEGSRSNKTTNCTNNGDITLLGPGKVRCGGIHGGSGAISNCKNTGDIVANNGTSCAIGGISGFSSNGLKITGVRNEGDVISRASGIYVGGLIGNVGNSAGTGDWTGGSSVACTVSSVDTDQTIVGMLVGYWNGTSAAVTVGKEGDPVLVTGVYNGTKLTAGNFSNYLAGTNNSAAIHEIYASFDPTPYESEGGGEAETPALDAPSNVTVAVYYNYTTVSWDAVNGAEWYVVEYQKSGENWTPCPKTENTSYDIYGLDHGSAYKFRVKAYASTGSGYSEEKSGETLPEVNLSAPTLSEITPAATEIALKWSAAANATGYSVGYKKAADSDIKVAVESTTETSYTITGLDPETAYVVYVKTLGAGGNASDWSAGDAVSTTELKKVSTPTDIVAAPKFEAVTLTFPAISGADSFEVYNGSTKLTSSVTSAAADANTVLLVSGLKTNESYSLQVKAISADPTVEASDLSAAVSAKTAEIKVVALSPTDVVLDWTDINASHKYEVALADASGNRIGGNYAFTVGNSTIPTGTSTRLPARFQYPGLQPGTAYKLLVKENGDENFTAFDVTTAAKHVAGANEVLFQGFDDFFWAGDCRNMATSLMSKTADVCNSTDWPVSTEWIWDADHSAIIAAGTATRSSAIFTYALADPECSAYGYSQAGVEMHTGYVKVGSGTVIGYMQTAELGTGKLNATTPTACTITAKVCPRSDGTASTAKINIVVVHADATETKVLEGFSVLTDNDSYNYSWKEAKATGVQLLSTDKVKIIADTDTAHGSHRFHLDDILIVTE